MRWRGKFAVNPCGGKNKFVKKGRVDFFGWEQAHSLASFGSWVGISGLQECVTACVGLSN